LFNEEDFSKGKIFVLSAPSGTGKTTLVSEIKRHFPQLVESVSYTTRKPRKNEVNKEDYFFISHKDFKDKIADDFFVEWAEVYGEFYGTSANFIQTNINNGKFMIRDIDVQGALNIKKMFPKEASLIFILPPSMEELEKRIRQRGTDDNKVIEKRLNNAKKEVEFINNYNFVVVNDRFEAALNLLLKIIQVEIDASFIGNLDTIRRFLNK
jgi:guanylate kinase